MATRYPDVTFRALTADDLPTLHEWLSRPHVAEWWDEQGSYDELERDYAPSIAGVGPVHCYVVVRGDADIGFIQSYVPADCHDDGWWLEEFDRGVRGIDQFLADPAQLGQGLGTQMIRAFVAQLFADTSVTRIQADPSPTNARAIRCYKRVGFRAAREVDTPDGRALLMVCDRTGLNRT
jgi:RimJ/RimL family protein N-acetyltransferase